jgi:hypothetical protein
MNPQEMQVLETFLNQLTAAKASAKDPQAEHLVADAVARQPDASYLLVQRALLLDQALASAKAQISALQGQLQSAQAASSSNFLDSANAWGNSAAARPAAPPAMAAPASFPTQAQGPAIPPAQPGFLSGGFGHTVGTIAATAAGVAGGAFLFQGIENLMHHNSGSGFLGQPAMGSTPSETTIVNNYYGDDRPSSGDVNDSASDNSFLDDGWANDDMGDGDSSVI